MTTTLAWLLLRFPAIDFFILYEPFLLFISIYLVMYAIGFFFFSYKINCIYGVLRGCFFKPVISRPKGTGLPESWLWICTSKRSEGECLAVISKLLVPQHQSRKLAKLTTTAGRFFYLFFLYFFFYQKKFFFFNPLWKSGMRVKDRQKKKKKKIRSRKKQTSFV